MASNLTVEAPNFEKIADEAGDATSNAISILWAALNDTRAVERRDFRRASETISPKVLSIAPSASVDNLDLTGASVLSFTGASSVNVTGFRAPETNRTHILYCHVGGAGTMTFKQTATSESQNQLSMATGADVARATGAAIVFVYLNNKWREVART
jgi:hypothetical protein